MKLMLFISKNSPRTNNNGKVVKPFHAFLLKEVQYKKLSEFVNNYDESLEDEDKPYYGSVNIVGRILFSWNDENNGWEGEWSFSPKTWTMTEL